ncbi:MAG: Hsp20/alpha crystallin family protein [Eubacteriales bacterium]|nr:Hsp20/alpha crystallin family protein [Eubacteriales bacterium]
MTLVPYEKLAFGGGLLRDFFGERALFGSVMKADVKETKDAFIVEAEMPGVKKEDVTLICENGVLTISAKISDEKNEEKENYVRKERVTGEVKRSFALRKIDEENIAAKFEDGILYVTLPKKEPEEKHIDIE